MAKIDKANVEAAAEPVAKKQRFFQTKRFILAIFGFFLITIAYNLRLVLNLTLTQMAVKKEEKPAGKLFGVLGGGLEDGPISMNFFNDSDTPHISNIKYLRYASEYDEDLDRFKWSEKEQGMILSCFYIGYFIGHLPSALLCQKFGAKIIIIIGTLLGSLVSILTPVITVHGGYYALVVSRVVQGLGQGVDFPGLTFLLGKWIPVNERGRYGTFVYAGSQLGGFFCNLCTGRILDKARWVIPFYIAGVLGILWCIVFYFVCYDEPYGHPTISSEEKEYLTEKLGEIHFKSLPPVPWKYILTSYKVIFLVVCQFGYDWSYYIISNDLPKYFHDILHFEVKENGLFTAMGYLPMWIFAVLSGIVADVLYNKKICTLTCIRKVMTAICFMGPAILMSTANYITHELTVALMFASSLGVMGLYYSGIKLSSLDYSPNYAATLMGMINGVGAIAGFVVSNVIGHMAPNSTREEWHKILWLAFGIRSVCTVLYVLFATAEVQPWNDPDNMPAYLEQQKQLKEQKKQLKSQKKQEKTN